ncbi:putative NAD dependent epimerase/dehydratase [Colletotrichum godetiae]|uniref:NAD dependent epimerase/dehydratase n=1 Tax=Colletotrichum godetiae TaxID=1209918 RepID=A0AAJ0ARB2_9PEZI|nr:putative NAD dependent epimerase/dehydratase [Colletotrichum godetiae]KAK1676366.1 putative NAD dependent epimerase/dehydratase [Colletotrichum godetiae]
MQYVYGVQLTVLVTGANGYIGNAVARAFVRVGWITFGLVRSSAASANLSAEEINVVVGSINGESSYKSIQNSLPKTIDGIVSTTEVLSDYVPHFNNTISFLRTLTAGVIEAGGNKPLVMFTSGCKDYGVGPYFDGEAGLFPHTEDLPINPPSMLAPRAENATKIFDHTDVLRPVLLRLTNVYVRSASHYAGFFLVAAAAAQSGKPLVFPSKPNAVLGAVHIDDCGEAYVAIFNISAHRYETVDEVGQALVKEYKIKAGMSCVEPQDWIPGDHPWLMMLVGFPQWTDSSNLRKVAGWENKRPLFAEAVGAYRKAFEAAAMLGNPMIQKAQQMAGVACGSYDDKTA